MYASGSGLPPARRHGGGSGAGSDVRYLCPGGVAQAATVAAGRDLIQVAASAAGNVWASGDAGGGVSGLALGVGTATAPELIAPQPGWATLITRYPRSLVGDETTGPCACASTEWVTEPTPGTCGSAGAPAQHHQVGAGRGTGQHPAGVRVHDLVAGLDVRVLLPPRRQQVLHPGLILGLGFATAAQEGRGPDVHGDQAGLAQRSLLEGEASAAADCAESRTPATTSRCAAIVPRGPRQPGTWRASRQTGCTDRGSSR